MDVTREVAQQCKENVDEQVWATACDQGDTGWWNYKRMSCNPRLIRSDLWGLQKMVTRTSRNAEKNRAIASELAYSLEATLTVQIV